MPVRVRRALLAAAAPVLLVAPVADALCAAQVCVAVPPVDDAVRMVTTMIDGGGLPDDGDGSGVLCVYVKLSGAPPSGWGGAPDSKPPYVWQQTQKWGNEHPGEYDMRACILACTVAPDVGAGPCSRND